MRADGVRTVVWVTPWVNLDSRDGQVPPDPESERLHREPAPNYEPAARDGHFVRGADGEPLGVALVDGHRLAGRLHLARRRGVVARAGQARARARRRGHQGRRRRGLLLPRRGAFADGRTGAEAAWAQGLLYRRSMQRALDEVHPGERRAVRPPGLDRPAGGRRHLGRRPAVGLLVAAHARGGDAHRGRLGLLELVARRRRLPRRAARRRAARRSCCCAGCSSAASRR